MTQSTLASRDVACAMARRATASPCLSKQSMALRRSSRHGVSAAPNDSSATPLRVHDARADDRGIGPLVQPRDEPVNRARRHDRVGVEQQHELARRSPDAEVVRAREAKVPAGVDDAHAAETARAPSPRPHPWTRCPRRQSRAWSDGGAVVSDRERVAEIVRALKATMTMVRSRHVRAASSSADSVSRAAVGHGSAPARRRGGEHGTAGCAVCW